MSTRQHPRCEGKNKTRVLFNGKLAEASPVMTRVDLTEETITLHAGYAQGVTKGARFGLYQYHFNEHASNPCLATLEVTVSQKFYSFLAATERFLGIQSPAYARQISPGHGYNIKVYVSPALHEKLQGNQEWRDKFLSEDSEFAARPTSSPAEADFSLDLGSDGTVTFKTHNTLCNKHGFSRFPQTSPVRVKQLLDVLHSAAAWDWHIDRENPNPPFGNSVRIEMFRVKKDLNAWDNNIAGHPFIRDSPNLNFDGVVNIVADPSHSYGYRIVNDTTHDLFPYLFYFEASMLSIEHLDLGPAPAASGMKPLRSMQHLSIGYGSSCLGPSAFFLEDGQTLDVGIIKLFVTTSPISFGLIEQESPFDEDGRGNTRKVVLKSVLTNAGFWDTQSLVVIQHDTLPVPTAESSIKTTVSLPFDLDSPLSTPQSLGGAVRTDLSPAHNHDKDSDSPRSLRVDALPNEATGFMVQYVLTVEELITCLGNRGCADITAHLDLESCTTYPLFSGGFGDIYRGKMKDGVDVAIKTMRLYVAAEDGDKKRLNRVARELYTWSKFNHPNITKLLGLVKFRDQVGMISTWETNGSLDIYLKKRPQANRCRLSNQIAGGLWYLHQTGVVHGDLKGANVLISRDGNALLADFGNSTLQMYTLKFITSSGVHITARWAASDSHSIHARRSQLFLRQAPELLHGEGKHSVPADIYALGMTILVRFKNHAIHRGTLKSN
ncbi:hypothetical protein FRC06_001415 [Ceratobasidium sp. 370]|nr:hypothetical protein FRC06_001415 [Ceratobasidium sp. 370]